MNRIMIDLETMGTSANAAIIAIGAVRFGDGMILDRFETIVDLQSCLDIGLEVDASTVLWWMGRSEEARAQFTGEGKPISEALQDFSLWAGEKVDEVWGKGATFDNSILKNAYLKCGQKPPWVTWADRCFRTVFNAHPDVKFERVGTFHCAVDDAETQALHLMQIETEKDLYQGSRETEEERKIQPDDPNWIDRLTEVGAKAALRAAMSDLFGGQARVINRCLEIAEEAQAYAKGRDDFDTAYSGAARHIADKIRKEFNIILSKPDCRPDGGNCGA